MPWSSKGLDVHTISCTATIQDEQGKVFNCPGTLEMLACIIGVKMEMSYLALWDVVCKLFFHIFFKPLQLSSREVLHCKTIMFIFVRYMSTANHMPLSETYPAPLHFKHAPVFVFYSIQVSTNMPSYNSPIRILIDGRSYLTLI